MAIKILTLAASASLMLATAAAAAPITENLSFSITNFLDAGGFLPAPIATLSGSFSATFDPSLPGGYNNDTADLKIHSLSFTTGSTVAFAYSPTYQVLSFGGEQCGVGSICGGTDDFVIQFNLADLANPKLSLCSDPGFSCGSLQGNSSYLSSGYTQRNAPGHFWLALAGTTTPVPEPSALAILGLGGIVLATRRRRA